MNARMLECWCVRGFSSRIKSNGSDTEHYYYCLYQCFILCSRIHFSCCLSTFSFRSVNVHIVVANTTSDWPFFSLCVSFLVYASFRVAFNELSHKFNYLTSVSLWTWESDFFFYSVENIVAVIFSYRKTTHKITMNWKKIPLKQ